MEVKPIGARQALEAVEEARSQVGRLRRSVKALRSKCGSPRISNLGASLSGRSDPHQQSWDVLADQSTQLERKERQLAQMEQQLENWIDQLPKPRWRMVLRSHYLDGLDLPDVARELSQSTGREFSMSQIYRFHRQALEAADKLWPMN